MPNLGVRVIGCFVIVFLVPMRGYTQIITDGTVGPAVPLSGPDYRIGADLGAIRGANLFHSFRSFGIGSGETAIFSGPSGIENVISRVTGGETTRIDGLLRSEVGTADFFLINPAGVIFGPGAQLDVPGAFHTSTADEIRFSDGSVYSATDPYRSSLTTASPGSFGFLSRRPSPVSVQGSQLNVSEGEMLSLSGGDVLVKGTQSPAIISATGGEVRLSAVGSQVRDVAISGDPGIGGGGDLQIDFARIDAAGNGGGKIMVRAGVMAARLSVVTTDNRGDADATGGIDIAVADSIELSASRIQSNAFAAGDSGAVIIRADALHIESGGANTAAGLFSEVEPGAGGTSGGVEVRVGGMFSIQGPAGIETSTWGSGTAGDVLVTAGEMVIDSRGARVRYRDVSGNISSVNGDLFQAGIGSDTWFGGGDAGSIHIDIGGLATIRNRAAISTSTDGNGAAGSITLQAHELSVDGHGVPTAIRTDALADSMQAAGSIRVDVSGPISLSNGGSISSSSYGAGDAGIVDVEGGSLRIDHRGARVPSGIFSELRFDREHGPGSATGSGGDIDVSIEGMVEIVNNGGVYNGGSISSSTSGAGDAGSVAIHARALIVDNMGPSHIGRPGRPAGVHSEATNTASGSTGQIRIDIQESLELRNGARISIFANQQPSVEPPVRASDNGIRISSPSVRLHGSSVTAESTGNFAAAGIEILAEDLFLDNESRITTESRMADGGPIRIGGSTIYLRDSLVTTSVIGSLGDGGDIRLFGKNLVLQGGFIQANTAAANARGGDILVDTESLVASRGLVEIGGAERDVFLPGSGRNVIQAAAPGGEQGRITTTAPELDISSVFADIDPTLAEPFGTDTCNRLVGKNASGLTWCGRGGLPPSGDAAEPALIGGRVNRVLDEVLGHAPPGVPSNHTLDRKQGATGRSDEVPSPVPPDLPTLSELGLTQAINEEPSFELKLVEIRNVSRLPTDGLERRVDTFFGRRVSPSDVEDLRVELTRYFVDLGYINTGVVHDAEPDREQREGIASFRIVEGYLKHDDIHVKVRSDGPLFIPAAKNNIAEYVSARMAPDADLPYCQKDMESRFSALLYDPLIDRVRGRLIPGTDPGQALMELDVTPRRPVSVDLRFDNHRPPSTGAERVYLGASLLNLSGHGDQARLMVGTGLQGKGKEIDSDFSIPLNRVGTRLHLGFTRNDTSLVEEPLRDLDIESETQRFFVGLSHAFDLTSPRCKGPGASHPARIVLRPQSVSTQNQELKPLALKEPDVVTLQTFDLGGYLSWAENSTTLLGEPFSFSAGAVRGESRVAAMRLFQSYRRSRPSAPDVPAYSLVLRSTLSLGVDAFDATIHGGSLPDGEFVSWLGQAVYRRELKLDRLELAASGALQLASETLLPLERFAVGGAGTVRGYRENTLVGDEGYYANLELRYRLARRPKLFGLPGLIRVALFADAGSAWDHGRRDHRLDLSSVGIGLLLDVERWFSAGLYTAHAFSKPQVGDDYDLQDDGIHFRVARIF